MKIKALTLTLGLCVMGCASGKAASPPPQPAPVEAPAPAAPDCKDPLPMEEIFGVWQLLSLHKMALSAETLREISPDPAAALLYLYERQDFKVTTRHRAFEALSFVPDDRVKALYRRVLRDADSGPLRHKAILGFARAFPDEATDVLGGVLATDVDVQIRLTAAQALGRFCGDKGRALVRQAIDAEAEGWARDKLRRYAEPPRDADPDADAPEGAPYLMPARPQGLGPYSLVD
jgi:hypothetical protein